MGHRAFDDYLDLDDLYPHCNGNCPTSEFIPAPPDDDGAKRVSYARGFYIIDLAYAHRKTCPLGRMADQELLRDKADKRRAREELLRGALSGRTHVNRYDMYFLFTSSSIPALVLTTIYISFTLPSEYNATDEYIFLQWSPIFPHRGSASSKWPAIAPSRKG